MGRSNKRMRPLKKLLVTSADIRPMTTSSLSGVNALPPISEVRKASMRRHTSVKEDMDYPLSKGAFSPSRTPELKGAHLIGWHCIS